MLPHHPSPRDHDVAPRPAGAGEHQRVEQVLRRACRAGCGRACRPPAASARAPAHQPPAPARRPPRRRRRARATNRRSGGRRHAGLRARPRRCAGAAPGAGRIRASAAPRASARVDVAVGADRQRHAGVEPAGQVGQAVAEVGLGARADHDAGAAARPPRRSRRASRAWRAPAASAHRAAARAPATRSAARRWRRCSRRPRAVCSATWMWIGPSKPSASASQLCDRRRRGGAQRVDREAGAHAAGARLASMPSRRVQTLARRAGEAALVVAQRRLREAGALVQHRQQRQADAGLAGGVGQRPRQLERVGVRRAVGVVLQVVELADLRVAAAQQLDVQLRRDRAQLLRRDAQRDAVHAVAPRPEVVVRTRRAARPGRRRRAGTRGCARSTRPGSSRAGEHGGVGRRSRRRASRSTQRPSAPTSQQHAVAPAAGQPGARRPAARRRVSRHRASQSRHRFEQRAQHRLHARGCARRRAAYGGASSM